MQDLQVSDTQSNIANCAQDQVRVYPLQVFLLVLMRTLVSLVKTRINCSLASGVQPKLLHPVMEGWPDITCCNVAPCVRNL